MRDKLTGWKDVFSFTFRQTLKSKAYKGSLIILLFISFISMPLLNLFLGNTAKTIENHITKLYVKNETSLLELDFSGLNVYEPYQAIEVISIPDSTAFETIIEKIQTEETSTVAVWIQSIGTEYFLQIYYSKAGKVIGQEVEQFSQTLKNYFETEKMRLSGLNKEQIEIALEVVTTQTYISDENGLEVVEEDTSITQNEYWFIYGLLFIVLMVSTMSASQVAMSIVSDKSSKVVEFLLTSIRPLAIIVGKVLSMLLAVVLQLFSVGIVVFISGKISNYLFPEAGNPLSGILSADILNNLNLGNFLLCLIMISLGLVFYATLAGLSGATVSKVEEVGEGQMLFTIVDLIGAYIGIGAAGGLLGDGVNAFVIFAFLFPLSAPYILPGAILAGKAGIGLIIGAMALELVAVILLFLFVARVYEVLILHNGERVHLKEMFKIFKTSKGGSHHE